MKLFVVSDQLQKTAVKLFVFLPLPSYSTGTAPPRSSPPLIKRQISNFPHLLPETAPPSIVWHFPLILLLRILKVKKNKGTPFEFFMSQITSEMVIENSPP